MSNEIAVPENVKNMAAALARSASVTQSGGETYLKFTKDGEWLYGPEETVVEEDSQWAINPHGMQHGWTAWGSKKRGNPGVNVGEVLRPATEALPDFDSLPEVNGDWVQCIAMQLRCMSGEDEGLQVIFKSNSRGGRNAYAEVLSKMIDQMVSADSAGGFVPVVSLEQSSYKHSEYGKIFTPIFKLEDWANDAGEVAAEAEALPEPEQESEPEPQPEPEPVAEDAGDLPPVRRRRRRA